MTWYPEGVTKTGHGRPEVQALTFPPVVSQALDLGDPGQEQAVFS